MPNSIDQRCKCHHKISVALYTDWRSLYKDRAYASLMRFSSVEVRPLESGCGQLLMKRNGDIGIWTFSEFSRTDVAIVCK